MSGYNLPTSIGAMSTLPSWTVCMIGCVVFEGDSSVTNSKFKSSLMSSKILKELQTPCPNQVVLLLLEMWNKSLGKQTPRIFILISWKSSINYLHVSSNKIQYHLSTQVLFWRFIITHSKMSIYVFIEYLFIVLFPK